MPTVQPIINTPDLPRLQAFYTELLGAREVVRFPEEGPPFYVGLALGDSQIGLANAAGLDVSIPSRTLLSVDVPDVDALLPAVEAAGGHVQGPSNDMPWGQRVAHVSDPDGNTVNLTQAL